MSQPTHNAGVVRRADADVSGRAVTGRLPTATLDFWERRHKSASREFEEAQKTREAMRSHPDQRRRALADMWCTATEHRLAACALELEFARERDATGEVAARSADGK